MNCANGIGAITHVLHDRLPYRNVAQARFGMQGMMHRVQSSSHPYFSISQSGKYFQ
jgi:hypothetical protein